MPENGLKYFRVQISVLAVARGISLPKSRTSLAKILLFSEKIRKNPIVVKKSRTLFRMSEMSLVLLRVCRNVGHSRKRKRVMIWRVMIWHVAAKNFKHHGMRF